MSFWFCGSCKKTWHSYIISPSSVKNLRCFYCLKEGAVKIKDEALKHMDGKMTYDNYRWFKRNNGRIAKKNGLHKKK
jgi:molybdenum cofactor biosynthesis enzyme MoaA